VSALFFSLTLNKARAGDYCDQSLAELTKNKDELNTVASFCRLCCVFSSFSMLFKTCFGYVTLGLLANLTAKLMLIYRKQGSDFKLYTYAINFLMALGIFMSIGWQSYVTFESKQNYVLINSYASLTKQNIDKTQTQFREQLRLVG
jgi:TM2 domain-containing membrane protein YozV